MIKYHNQYRIESTRLQSWDYSDGAWYFVTICTKDQKEFFGNIVKGNMKLYEMGEIVKDEWLKTGTVRDNVGLDYYCIMPNHIHGIIIINKDVETTRRVVSNNELAGKNETVEKCLQKNKNEIMQIKNETTHSIVSTTIQSNSLGSIVGQFKSICTKRIRSNGYVKFHWQSGFYDRIIRNEKELFRIRRYIELNPLKWELEKSSCDNLQINY